MLDRSLGVMGDDRAVRGLGLGRVGRHGVGGTVDGVSRSPSKAGMLRCLGREV
jgi:hypothetical protein